MIKQKTVTISFGGCAALISKQRKYILRKLSHIYNSISADYLSWAQGVWIWLHMQSQTHQVLWDLSPALSVKNMRDGVNMWDLSPALSVKNKRHGVNICRMKIIK